MMLKEKVDEAHRLGQMAFLEGRDCIPCLDTGAMDLIKGFKPGEGAADILLSWTRGYRRLLLAKQPWEMTKNEWETEFAKTQVNLSSCGSESLDMGKSSSLTANGIREQFLKMSLKDTSTTADDNKHLLAKIPRHQDIIKHAISLKMPIPENVLAEYLGLLETQTA